MYMHVSRQSFDEQCALVNHCCRESVMEDAMVAVASDGDKATADLLPSDWELMPLRRVSEEYGVLSVEGEVLAGHRMKMMVGSLPRTGTRSVRQTLPFAAGLLE